MNKIKKATWEEMDKILHSPFNAKVHKDTFTNYLEVCIDREGNVYYAIPSHVHFLEAALFRLEHPEREYEIQDGYAPREWVYHRVDDECVCKSGHLAISAWDEYLMEKTGFMTVTNNIWRAVDPTEKQMESLRNLYQEIGIEEIEGYDGVIKGYLDGDI